MLSAAKLILTYGGSNTEFLKYVSYLKVVFTSATPPVSFYA